MFRACDHFSILIFVSDFSVMRPSVSSTVSFASLSDLDRALTSQPDCLADATLIKISGRRYRISASGIASEFRSFWQRLKDCFTCHRSDTDSADRVTEVLQRVRLQPAQTQAQGGEATITPAGPSATPIEQAKHAFERTDAAANKAKGHACQAINLVHELTDLIAADESTVGFSHARTTLPCVEIEVAAAVQASRHAVEALGQAIGAYYDVAVASKGNKERAALVKVIDAAVKAEQAAIEAKSAAQRAQHQLTQVKMQRAEARADTEAAGIAQSTRF